MRPPDPQRRQEGRAELLRNRAVGQRLLQFGDARVGDLRTDPGNDFQAGHPGQLCHACVAAGPLLDGCGSCVVGTQAHGNNLTLENS